MSLDENILPRKLAAEKVVAIEPRGIAHKERRGVSPPSLPESMTDTGHGPGGMESSW